MATYTFYLFRQHPCIGQLQEGAAIKNSANKENRRYKTSPTVCKPTPHFVADAVQCIVSGEEKPQNCPFPVRFRHPAGGWPSHGHRQHAQEILVKIAHVVSEIYSRTDKHTHRQIRSQYFAAPPAGKVNISEVAQQVSNTFKVCRDLYWWQRYKFTAYLRYDTIQYDMIYLRALTKWSA